MNFEFSSRIRARRAAGCWRECYSMPSRSHRAAIDRPRRRGHRVRRRELMFLLGGEMTAARALRAQQKAMPVGLLSPRWPRPARFTVYGRVPPRAKRNRLRRGTKPGDRIPVSGGPLRSTARIGADDEGAGPPRGKCRLVEVEEKIPGRHGLTAGGRWIRTFGTAARKPEFRGIAGVAGGGPRLRRRRHARDASACRRSEQPSRPGAINRSGGDGAAVIAARSAAPNFTTQLRRCRARARRGDPRRLSS